MPIYKYKCERCSREILETRKIELRDESIPCVSCRGNLHRIPYGGNTGFILKGKGWFKDGYA